MEKMEALKKFDLFSGLSDENLNKVSEVTVRQDYEVGNTIVRADEPGRAIYAVVEGEVRIFSHSRDGRQITFSIIYPGDFFGELAIIDEEPRSASAVAFGKTTVFIIYKNDFVSLLNQFPQIGQMLMKRLASRLRATDRHLETMAFYNRFGKVAWALLKLAEKGETELDEGVRLPPVTHQEIANLIVSSRESVSRSLSYFEKKGWIESAKRKIILRDTEALRNAMK